METYKAKRNTLLDDGLLAEGETKPLDPERADVKEAVELEFLEKQPGEKKAAAPAKPEVTKPEGEELQEAIKAVIPKLDKEKDFTGAGTPKVAAVEELLGYDVSAGEVKKAHDALSEGGEAE